MGHSLHLRGVYNNTDALPLRDAVALAPPLSPPPDDAPEAASALRSQLKASRVPVVPRDAEQRDEKIVHLADVVLRNRNRPKR